MCKQIFRRKRGRVMTREDAIKTLKELWRETNDTWYEEVYKMAINALEADRKTESDSEKPNDCDYAENPSGDVWECGCFLDTYCEHQIYDRNPDGTINIVECGYEPKDEPQTDFMRGFLQGLHDAVAEIVDEPQTESE